MNGVGKPSLRLGTRGSLLAVAQSKLVAQKIGELRPDINIELIKIQTRGDKNQVTPLSRVSDKDFFNAELDTALESGQVDFCVHSFKDLAADRPPKFELIAIPERAQPGDIVIFRADVVERLRQALPVRIGSSSVRRQAPVGRFLQTALPRFGAAQPRITFVPIRGAVEKRLERLKIEVEEDSALDGVVLAIAGLTRLWGDADGQKVLRRALDGTRRMVLPLSACPTAPGQGALAIECRANDDSTKALLRLLHDERSAQCVRAEQAFTEQYPLESRGGIGATAIRHEVLNQVMYARVGPNTNIVWDAPAPPDSAIAWDGSTEHSRQTVKQTDSQIKPTAAVFVAHWRAATDSTLLRKIPHVWTSGTASWRQLADRGIWVEGCADNLGFAANSMLLNCGFLQLPPLLEWTALTHADAVPSWSDSGVGNVVGTYVADSPISDTPERTRATIGQSTHFFWSSMNQFRQLRGWVPENATHACGAGKTMKELLAAGVTNVTAFPSRTAWRQWLN